MFRGAFAECGRAVFGRQPCEHCAEVGEGVGVGRRDRGAVPHDVGKGEHGAFVIVRVVLRHAVGVVSGEFLGDLERGAARTQCGDEGVSEGVEAAVGPGAFPVFAVELGPDADGVEDIRDHRAHLDPSGLSGPVGPGQSGHDVSGRLHAGCLEDAPERGVDLGAGLGVRLPASDADRSGDAVDVLPLELHGVAETEPRVEAERDQGAEFAFGLPEDVEHLLDRQDAALVRTLGVIEDYTADAVAGSLVVVPRVVREPGPLVPSDMTPDQRERVHVLVEGVAADRLADLPDRQLPAGGDRPLGFGGKLFWAGTRLAAVVEPVEPLPGLGDARGFLRRRPREKGLRVLLGDFARHLPELFDVRMMFLQPVDEDEVLLLVVVQRVCAAAGAGLTGEVDAPSLHHADRRLPGVDLGDPRLDPGDAGHLFLDDELLVFHAVLEREFAKLLLGLLLGFLAAGYFALGRAGEAFSVHRPACQPDVAASFERSVPVHSAFFDSAHRYNSCALIVLSYPE